MPKQGVFTLAGPLEGKTMVILEKYPFVDGVFKTQAVYAPLMARMLCEYYGAVLTYEGEDDVQVVNGDEDGSLAVSATRGLTEGQKMENHDLSSKLELARKEEAAEAALAEKREADRKAADAKLAAEADAAAAKK